MRKAIFRATACLCLLAACKKDRPPVLPGAGNISSAKQLLICNEGNFGQGNATITVYDPVNGVVVPDVYAPANNNQYIGDVLQSVASFNSKYYWVVNNSKKIVVTGKDFVQVANIAGFISPRYIKFVSNNKAYVTNLQLNASAANYLQVVDLNTNVITKSVRLDGWTEQMAQSYGEIFVCNQGRKYVYVIDAVSDQVSDSIFVNATTSCVVKDQNEKLWVSCNADAGNNVPARLVRIDPVTHLVEADISLQTSQRSISALAVNGNGSTLYYLMNDVYKMAITSTSPSPVILQGNRVFYNLLVDPEDESIYVSDAIDYNQAGTLLKYNTAGTQTASVKTGIIPGFMLVE